MVAFESGGIPARWVAAALPEDMRPGYLEALFDESLVVRPRRRNESVPQSFVHTRYETTHFYGKEV